MNKQTQSPATTRYTALVADDDARVRRTLAWLLQHSQEWELVDAVADGASALQCAAERHPDLVLLDFRLPDGDGAIWIPRLCALRPPPLVVVLIEDATRAIYDQVLHLGAVACLPKFLAPTDIFSELHRLCSKRDRAE